MLNGVRNWLEQEKEFWENSWDFGHYLEVRRRPMQFYSHGTHSCGVKDIKGMNSSGRYSSAAVIKFILSHHGYLRSKHTTHTTKNAGFSHFHFCYAYDEGNKTGARSLRGAKRMEAFKKYVESRNLGTCVITEPNPNPIHGGRSVIISMLFTPNHEEMCKLGETMSPKWQEDEEWIIY
jgi:hypothetical protein